MKVISTPLDVTEDTRRVGNTDPLVTMGIPFEQTNNHPSFSSQTSANSSSETEENAKAAQEKSSYALGGENFERAAASAASRKKSDADSQKKPSHVAAKELFMEQSLLGGS